MFFESNYILNIVVAMLKYTIMEQVSTNVVINGEAINAGSRPIFLANSGRSHQNVLRPKQDHGL